MAKRVATVTIKNTGNVSITFNIGWGLAAALFDPATQGFPKPPYLGDLAMFGADKPDVRNVTLNPGQSATVTVTFYDDSLISTYGGKTIYFIVAIWDTEFKTLYAYKFVPFTVTQAIISFDISATIS